MKVELQVVFLTEDAENSALAGLDIDPDECELQPMTFYNIEHIYEGDEEREGYCAISSGGKVFTVLGTRKEIEELIEKATEK